VTNKQRERKKTKNENKNKSGVHHGTAEKRRRTTPLLPDILPNNYDTKSPLTEKHKIG